MEVESQNRYGSYLEFRLPGSQYPPGHFQAIDPDDSRSFRELIRTVGEDGTFCRDQPRRRANRSNSRSETPWGNSKKE